jgi:hypothetical protein
MKRSNRKSDAREEAAFFSAIHFSKFDLRSGSSAKSAKLQGATNTPT